MISSVRLTLLCALVAIVGVATPAHAVSVPVKTLTHNVDGLNWSTNSASIIASLDSQNADIMSLQEIFTSSTALQELKTAYVTGGTYSYSPGYFDGNTANESPSNITDNLILWRASMFTVDWAGSGAVAWSGSGIPMDVNWVTLTHIASGIEIMVFNTHLGFSGGTPENEAANQAQAVFLAQIVDANRGPGQIAIMTGDMNANNTSPTIEFLLGGEELLGETFSMAFADVEGGEKDSPIDYIMVPSTLNLACASVVTVDTASDHDLVAAVINLDDGDDASVAACEGREFLTPPLERGSIVNGIRVFDLEMAPGMTRFFPFDVDTPTSGYNGSYLGPTLEMRTGENVKLAVTNHLGGRQTTTHWHGLHVPGAMDGGPHQVIVENATWNAEFPMLNRASTFWYHPHPHAMFAAQDPEGTAYQVYEGLAGMLIVRDDETDTLALPNTYGVDEFPLIIQDKRFNEDGSLFHLDPPGSGTPVLRRGGIFLTNGIVASEFETPAQVIRFRLLNASNARFYNLGLKDGRIFYQIGSDGGLLSAPVPITRLLIGPSERMEILIDFGADLGRRVTLRAYNSELSTRIVPNVIADEWDRTDFDIMDFNVTASSAAPITAIPASLVPVELIPEGEAHNLGSPRLFELTLNETINGLKMNIDFINEEISLGDTEVWLVTNVTRLAHPFHVHGDSFQILTRNGAAPIATEAGWKDSVRVEPGDEVRIIKRFLDYADSDSPYMYHCHILDHEDAGMMGQFVVVGDADPVPTPSISACGLGVMMMLLLTAGTLICRRVSTA